MKCFRLWLFFVFGLSIFLFDLDRKHYISQHALEEHRRGKVHKKRVKETEEVPYSVEESERAGGLGSYLPPPAKRSKPNPTLIEDDIKIADD